MQFYVVGAQSDLILLFFTFTFKHFFSALHSLSKVLFPSCFLKSLFVFILMRCKSFRNFYPSLGVSYIHFYLFFITASYKL